MPAGMAVSKGADWLASPTRVAEPQGLQRGGTIDAGGIRWDDGRTWQKVVPRALDTIFADRSLWPFV